MDKLNEIKKKVLSIRKRTWQISAVAVLAILVLSATLVVLGDNNNEQGAIAVPVSKLSNGGSQGTTTAPAPSTIATNYPAVTTTPVTTAPVTTDPVVAPAPAAPAAPATSAPATSAPVASASSVTPAATTTPAYDYIVNGKVVKSASGTTVYTGSSFTTALSWACKQVNKRVYVPAGTWSITSTVNIGSGVTLFGAGSGTSGTVFNFASSSTIRLLALNVDHVTMHDFRITGAGRIEIRATAGSTHSGFVLKDIVAYRTQTSSFSTWTYNKATLKDISFYRCQAIESMGCGFWIGGDYSNQPSADTRANAGWTKNVYFEDCKALWIGKNGQTGNYVCGFDLSEGTNVQGMHLLRCQSDYSWMDGFHFEMAPKTLDCVFTDCSASYNGQRGSGNGWTYRTETGVHETTLTNCKGIGNKGGDAYNISLHKVYDLPNP